MKILSTINLTAAVLALSTVFSCTSNEKLIPDTNFSAYYTKMATDAGWEKYDRTGAYSDIIVNLGDNNGQFIFWRGSSYLPYWQTAQGAKYYVDEIVERNGDGSDEMPDKVNTYSHVAIVSASDSEAVIHWRYLPDFAGSNPHIGVVATDFVDEYFIIQSDGQITRTLKQGTLKIDAWNDAKNVTTQTLQLQSNGIQNLSLDLAKTSEGVNKIEGVPLVANTPAKPIAWFKFDEAGDDQTYETQGQAKSEITGDKTVWKKGVSGTALQFDGYKTTVKFPAEQLPTPTQAITLEGWLSIGAYPWSWCPLVQQTDDVPEEVRLFRGDIDVTDLEKREGDVSAGLVGGDPENQEGEHEVESVNLDEVEFIVKYQKEDDRGYFLGIDGKGRPGFKIKVGGIWEELTSDNVLDRKQWYHLAATYDQSSGKMILYLNGKKTAERQVAKAPIELSKKDLQIGRGKDRRPIDPVRENTFPGTYSFDGLIDEVKIYDVALSSEDIQNTFQLYKADGATADLQNRVLPSGENRNEFGAYYTQLKFYDNWDNMWRFSEHSDVVVEFEDNPSKFVFWKGVSYIPMIVNERNFWYSNEFNETWSTSGGEGCQEPMSDKQVLYNHVRILENTPARAVVHYRFPLVDVNKIKANYVEETGWYDVADWYYYVYPDGIAAKVEQLWTSGNRDHEWQESMAIFGPDQHPHDLIERKSTFTMVRVKDGAYQSYDWNPLPPDAIDQPEGANIHHINYKGDYDPVTITSDIIWSNVYAGELTDYAIFPTWNHWPVAQMASDGRYASFPDRTSHSSLSHIYWADHESRLGDRPFQKKILLEGMKKEEPLELIPLAKSWLSPAELADVNGGTGAYNQEERAYIFDKKDEQLSMRIMASEEKPVENLCFVIKQWNKKEEADVSVDGKSYPTKQGTVRDTDGSLKLVIWMETSTNNPLEVQIRS